MGNNQNKLGYASALLLTACMHNAYAIDWQDNSVGISWGNKYREPENPRDVTKTVLNFTHVSGDRLGLNLFVSDLLLSTKSDPAKNGKGATEIYIFYKRSFSLSALTGADLSNSIVKDWYINGRIDYAHKNTVLKPSPKKLRLGVSTDLAVPVGYVNIGVDLYKERNHNAITGKNFDFKTTYAAYAVWNIPVSSRGSIEGMIDHIGAMGDDGFGINTKPQTLATLNYIHDIGEEGGFKLGVGLQYWRNKYNNDNRRDSHNGSTQKSYTLQVKYHF